MAWSDLWELVHPILPMHVGVDFENARARGGHP